jgi:hypothetical protein
VSKGTPLAESLSDRNDVLVEILATQFVEITGDWQEQPNDCGLH